MKTTHVCFCCGCLYVYNSEDDNKYEDVCPECTAKFDVARDAHGTPLRVFHKKKEK